MRTALGARRVELVRQLLLEALLTSVLGAGLGLAGAWIGDLALRAKYAAIPQLADVHLDWRVVAFTCAVTVLTCVMCGLTPAWMASRVDPMEALKEGGRTAAGSTRQSFRRVLVALQLGLSLMLVIASGLLAQSILRMQRQDMGFQPEQLLKAHFYLPPARYGSAQAITQFCDRFAGQVRTLPGVKRASITTIFPPSDRWRMNFSLEGRPVSRLDDLPSAKFGVTDDQYLKTLGIALLRGRDFAETDAESTEPIAIVNQAFARRFFGDSDPVGAHLVMGTPANLHAPDTWLANEHVRVTIVGVMGDARNAGLTSPPEPQFITLFRQMPLVNFGFKDVVVQSQLPPELLEKSLRQLLQSLDSTLPLSETATMPEYLADLTWDQKLTAEVLGVFAALGAILAIVGVYGVMSFLVVRRRQEIGVRMALGASRKNVVWMVVRQGTKLAITGTFVGLAGALLAGRGVAGMLYGVRAFDPATLICASAGLMAAAILAALIPAWRAARIQPVNALRCE
jgi:putative ABC transport system permease protein